MVGREAFNCKGEEIGGVVVAVAGKASVDDHNGESRREKEALGEGFRGSG